MRDDRAEPSPRVMADGEQEVADQPPAREHSRSKPVAQGAKGTLRATAAYVFGNALQRAIAFLLLPFFTRAVSPAEYGQLSVAFSITGVTSVIAAFGFELAVYRTFFQLADDPPTQRRFVQTAWTFLILAPTAITAIASVIGIFVFSPDGLVTPLIFFLALAGGAMGIAGTRVPWAILRAEQRLKDFMILSIGGAVVTSSATVIAVLFLRAGVIGWLTAVVLAGGVQLALAMWLMPFRPGERFDTGRLRDTLRLGLPLMPHNVSQWSLQLADRLLLAKLVSTSALGVYSLGANLALPVMVLVTSVSQASYPTYARAATNPEALRALPRTIALQVHVISLITLAAALLVAPAVLVLSPSQYAGAASVGPWIVLGYGFLGLYSIPMGLASLTSGRTKNVWMITVLAAATNLGLIGLLVPSHGVIAAAVASAAGYAVLLVGVFFYARGSNRVALPWAKAGFTALVCVVVYAACQLSTPESGVAGVVGRLAWAGVAATAIGISVAGSPRRLLSLLRHRAPPAPR